MRMLSRVDLIRWLLIKMIMGKGKVTIMSMTMRLMISVQIKIGKGMWATMVLKGKVMHP